ncbi:MAG TPA: hypothetical protein VJZ76_06345 [Thermoanaerobaculia bacterium]|nr:hypothetical protein [Thermoanaerobaculia bacterium]
MVAQAHQLDSLFLPQRKLEIVPVPLPPPPPAAPGALLPSLPPAVAAKLTSGAELVRSLARQRREEVIPTTFAAVDELLGGGLARGKMTEIAGRGARWSLVIATIAAATSMGEAAGLVDLGDALDPQLAEEAGVDLRRVLWVRPKTFKEAVTAAEMLGATGFQLVVLDAGLPPIRGRRVPDAAWVRLARTCEAHGCTLLVSAPYALTGTTSEAMLYAHAPRARWLGGGKSPRVLAGVEMTVRLDKHRRIRPGQSVKLNLRVVP